MINRGIRYAQMVVIISICLLIIAAMIWPFMPFEKWHMLNDFKNDKNMLLHIANQLYELPNDDIYISDSYNNLTDDKISDYLINEINDLLKNYDYQYIEKNDRCIFFCKKIYSSRGIGVSYSYFDKKPKSNHGAMLYEVIEPHWYYCELD